MTHAEAMSKMEAQTNRVINGLQNQRARFEAEIAGAAAARIAQWDACKGQVEYVRVLATQAAHHGRIALGGI